MKKHLGPPAVLALIAIVLLIPVGCESFSEEVVGQTITGSLVTQDYRPDFIPYGVLGDPAFADPGYDPDTQDSRAATHSDFKEKFRATLLVLTELDNGSPWEDVDKLARSALEQELSSRVRFLVQSLLGVRMLRRLHDEGPMDLEAIAFYTDHLIEARSPNVHYILTSLEKLEGFWDAERIRYAAELAVAAGAHYIDSACAQCRTSLEGSFGSDIVESLDAHTLAVIQAIEGLEALADLN